MASAILLFGSTSVPKSWGITLVRGLLLGTLRLLAFLEVIRTTVLIPWVLRPWPISACSGLSPKELTST
jgi:hypothetical protein